MNRFLLASLLSAGMASAQPPPSLLLGREIAWANYYAHEFGVRAELVAAVIDVESAWQPAVVSPKGAVGIMQLMPATAYRFGVTNRFRIEENIRGGVAYLAYLMRQFGEDFRLAAAAYYAGERPIRKLGLACADPSIYRYVKAVERSYTLRRMIPAPSNASSNKGAIKP